MGDRSLVFDEETVKGETLDGGERSDNGGELSESGEMGCMYLEICHCTKVAAKRHGEPGGDVAIEEAEMFDVEETNGRETGETDKTVVKPELLATCRIAVDGRALLNCERCEMWTKSAIGRADEEEKGCDVVGLEKDLCEEMKTTSSQPSTTDSTAEFERGSVCMAMVNDGVVHLLGQLGHARWWWWLCSV